MHLRDSLFHQQRLIIALDYHIVFHKICTVKMFPNVAYYALFVRAGILFTPEKHFHDRIISLRGEIGVFKISITPPLVI
jgi:hypothetical protein